MATIDWQKRRDTSGASMLLDVAAELGLSQKQCLTSTDIDPDSLDSPLASISVWQELALIRNIQTLQNSDEGLGLMVSKRCTANAMGMFGQALATSETLAKARKLMERYGMLGLAFSRFEFKNDQHTLRMTLHDFEMPKDCQRFLEERGLGGCLMLFSDLLGQTLTAKSVSMRLHAPSKPETYHDFFGTQVEFAADKTEIVFERTIEQKPLPGANRKLHLASIRYCDEVAEAQTNALTYSGRVRGTLQHQDLLADLETVAQQFGISSRQLRRYLSEESTSFRDIQLELKFDRARALLRSGLSVNQTAQELGYSCQASFSRAFKKYTGQPPSQSAKQLTG
ncbi:MAG: AraC family transcriptional regulator [Candidatus Pelagadaptatus aseana]|uniref:AraC family transcriptional regulator n=1 Tax=Candidatus Pelagadaptatus aseana TaxID=3120508 RepID=UPI0039B332AB